jgi:glycine/D-amino acid oxidase-like deaminating enzyme
MQGDQDLGRRAFLKTGGTGLLGLTLGGCASRATRLSGLDLRTRLEPVQAKSERIIRTTVGLRPFRPSGFVVRAERFDARLLIHNYGHGGAGHSLGWGTGLLAAELASEDERRRVAVVGCGTVGLTTARQLQRRGFTVTIYAKSLPPNTTSNMAFAGFTPRSGLVDSDRQTAAWNSQFRQAAEASYRELQLLAGRDYGISWVPTYALTNDVPRTATQSRPSLVPPQPGWITLQPGEHPFPSRYATQRPTLRIEPSIYLDALIRDFLAFGGRIVIREFDEPRDLWSLYEPIIVNCTGLGSRELFDDDELIPVKGQLTFLVPQPGVNYSTRGGVPGGISGGFLHMMPRGDGIALGGTAERGVWDMEPNVEASERILRAHQEMFSRMSPESPIATHLPSTGLREAPRLESFFDLQS